MHRAEIIRRNVAIIYKIPPSLLIKQTRERYIARPRQIAIYLCRKFTKMSYSEIAREFGLSDHTTAMHAVKAIEKLMTDDREIREDVQCLEEIMKTALV